MKIMDYNFPEYTSCDKPRLKNEKTGKYVALTTNKASCPAKYKMCFEINGKKYYPRGITGYSNTIKLGTISTNGYTSSDFTVSGSVNTISSLSVTLNKIKEFCPGTIVYLENKVGSSYKTVLAVNVDSNQSNWINANSNASTYIGKQCRAIMTEDDKRGWSFDIGTWSNVSYISASLQVADSSGSSTSYTYLQLANSSGTVVGESKAKDTGGSAQEIHNPYVASGHFNEDRTITLAQAQSASIVSGTARAIFKSTNNLSRCTLRNPIMWRKTSNIDYRMSSSSNITVSSNIFRIRVVVPGNLTYHYRNSQWYSNEYHAYRTIADSVSVSFSYY